MTLVVVRRRGPGVRRTALYFRFFAKSSNAHTIKCAIIPGWNASHQKSDFRRQHATREGLINAKTPTRQRPNEPPVLRSGPFHC
jgi:hypothetical protein